MKTTGIVRRLGKLGRVTIPKETLYFMGVSYGDGLHIFVDEESIIFKKYDLGCVFCGSVSDLSRFKGKHVCAKCVEEVKRTNPPQGAK